MTARSHSPDTRAIPAFQKTGLANTQSWGFFFFLFLKKRTVLRLPMHKSNEAQEAK